MTEFIEKLGLFEVPGSLVDLVHQAIAWMWKYFTGTVQLPLFADLGVFRQAVGGLTEKTVHARSGCTIVCRDVVENRSAILFSRFSPSNLHPWLAS